jgi:hypothetical protein
MQITQLFNKFVRATVQKLFERKFAQFAIAAIVFLCLVVCKPQPALAWKPTTHVYLAERALEDALDNGKVTINRVNSATGEIVGNIGEYPVAPKILDAIRAFPDQYRAGVLGPDAYPDILTGQQVIHPPTNPEGSTRWLQYLWSQSDESPAIKAFVVGYLTHAAGDMYGHTFVNHFTSGAFTFTPPSNATKHILLEGYFDQHSPSPTFSASIAGVDNFIYRHMVDARPDTYLDRELLVQGGEGTSFSVPRIYSTLRAELEEDIPRLFKSADRCRWFDPTCSALLLRAEARYKEAWRDDIDRGLRAWPSVSDRVAKALFFNPEKRAKVDEAEAILNDYVNQHLISMSGAPDVVGDLAAISDKILDIISQITPDFLLEPIRQLKNNIYDAIVVKATGMTRQQLKDYLSSPDTYFDQVMTQGSGELIDKRTFDSKYLRLDNPSAKYDYRKVAAAYNTVAISKLLLLSKDGVNQLLSDLGDNARLNQQNIMLGFLRTLDGDNEQRGMILAQNCATYRQIFMEQAGERLCIPVGRWLIDSANNGFGSWDNSYRGYGGADAIPAPADYDGDSKADLSVKVYDGRWLIDYASNGLGSWDWSGAQYGGADAIPAPADYDGDGKADLSVKVHDGRWLIDYASNGLGSWDWSGAQYGGADAIPAPADYDGDSKADLSVKVKS